MNNVESNGFRVMLTPAETVKLNGYQDCNIPGVWIDDKYRTFHGTFHKENDPHGKSSGIYKEGNHVIEAMTSSISVPYRINTSDGIDRPGIGMWIESIYQSAPNNKTLYALYHNENNYSTINDVGLVEHALGLDPNNLKDEVLCGPIIRIGLIKSVDGGATWDDLGIILQDDYMHFVILPHLVSGGYIGGTTDPSWINGKDGYMYIFYTEVSYPETYDPKTYDPGKEASHQGICIARIPVGDLDKPFDESGNSKVLRWDGKGFNSPGIGGMSCPIPSLKAPDASAVSQNLPHINWGPSVSWNKYLHAWTMTMTHACRRFLRSDYCYVSFNSSSSLSDPASWSRPARCTPEPVADLFPFFPVFQSESGISLHESTVELGRNARYFFVECTVKWDIDHNQSIGAKDRDKYLCFSKYNAVFLCPGDELPETPQSKETAFASSWSEDSHKGENVVDKNPDTYWEAGDESYDPASLVYDIGQKKHIQKITFKGVRNIDRCKIQIWDQLVRGNGDCTGDWVDMRMTSLSSTSDTVVLVEPAKARYIRFIVTKCMGRPRISEIIPG